jgi:hypothetical protein
MALMLRAAATLLLCAWATTIAADCLPVGPAPAVIGAPGSYCLVGDLVYDGPDAAVVIAADDVDLDLGPFSILGTAPPSAQTAGIRSAFRAGTRIRNGTIAGFRFGVELAGQRGVGPLIEDVEIASAHYIGIAVDGSGAIVRNCRVGNVGGSTVEGDTIPIGITLSGDGALIAGNTIVDVRLPAISGGEAVGIALDLSAGSVVLDNAIVNHERTPNTWAIWIADPGPVTVASNFVAGYETGVVYAGATGAHASNLFMNTPASVIVSPDVTVLDGGSDRSFRAACQPVWELPAVIAEPGRYCQVRNLSTAKTAGAAISIEADDVVLELGGFKIGGGSAGAATAASGVHAADRRGITIRGGNIRGFRRGVFLEETAAGASAGHLVEGVLADSNTEAGIDVMGAGSTVRRNQVVAVGGAAAPGAAAAAIRVTGPHARVLGNDVAAGDPGGGTPLVGIHVADGHGAIVEGNRVSLDAAVDSTAVLLADSPLALAWGNRLLRAARGVEATGAPAGYGRNTTVGVALPVTGGTDLGGNN